MKYFGYFVTESSGHASEYVPYFRKSAHMIEKELMPRFTDPGNSWFGLAATGGYLQHCIERWERFQAEYEDLAKGNVPLPGERTYEYGTYIMEATETNEPTRVNGNVPNRGLITNLPKGCCVEVPCLVDANGVQPTYVGALPTQLAAVNRTNVNVQELIVEAALTGKTDAVYHAVMLDPLTAAVCTLPQIHDMVTEMLSAQAGWLPQFAEK
jgi:alpha-galactosidase